MKLNKAASELLNRYLLGVKRELGGRDRDDIAAEIESYICDLLETRHPGDQEIGTAELEAVLKEMGSPRKVAAQYSPQRYLIGPRLFPTYWLVLRIVTAVVTGALLLSFIISFITEPPVKPWLDFLDFLSGVWNGIFMAAAMVTLVFAIIERTGESHQPGEMDEKDELKLDELPQLPEEERSFSVTGTSVECLLSFLGLIFLTYIHGTNGAFPIILNSGAQVQMAQLFTANFVKFIPAMMALSGLELTRSIMLLIQARHSSLTTWWNIALKSANIVLNGFLIASFPLITLDYFQWVFSGEILSGMESTVNICLEVILILSILGNLVGIIKKTVWEIRNPTY